MNQYIHLLTGSGPNMQNDIWVPVTDVIKPSLSRQFAIGLEKSFRNGEYELSLEAYHKTMNKLITYKDGVSNYSRRFPTGRRRLKQTAPASRMVWNSFFKKPADRLRVG